MKYHSRFPRVAPLAVVAALMVAAIFASHSTALAQQSAPSAQPAKPRPQAAQAAKPAQAAPSTPVTQAAAPASGGVQPQLLGQYGDWGAYTATPGGKKVCFALAKPAGSQTNPAGRPRDAAYMFISSRPAEKVRDEVSIIIGYGFKPNSDATIDLAGTNFAMYTQNDGAWIKNAAEEARLVESMRKGADLVVKGVSARGTQSSDTYSLKGLAQALDRVGQECK
jgi:Invasion associated locus B (IalB) protein